MSAKNFLQTDLKDLSSIRLEDVRSKLQSKPMMGLNVLLIAVAAGVLLFGLSASKSRRQTLSSELEEKRKKLDVYQELSKIKRDHDFFFRNLPEVVDRDMMIKLVSEIADRNSIQILSFFPGERGVNDLVRASTLDLNIAADDYDRLAGFIEAIENSNYLMRIERWSGHQVDVSSGDPANPVKQVIETRVEILALRITKDGAPPASRP